MTFPSKQTWHAEKAGILLWQENHVMWESILHFGWAQSCPEGGPRSSGGTPNCSLPFRGITLSFLLHLESVRKYLVLCYPHVLLEPPPGPQPLALIPFAKFWETQKMGLTVSSCPLPFLTQPHPCLIWVYKEEFKRDGLRRRSTFSRFILKPTFNRYSVDFCDLQPPGGRTQQRASHWITSLLGHHTPWTAPQTFQRILQRTRYPQFSLWKWNLGDFFVWSYRDILINVFEVNWMNQLPGCTKRIRDTLVS